MQTDWRRRLEAMSQAGEHVLYVTAAEFAELRSAVPTKYPRLWDVLEPFGGTPVVIDDAEAAAQIERTGADMTAGEFALWQHGITP